MSARILESARRFRAKVQALCQTSAQPFPDWWNSGWGNAVFIADGLATKLSGLSDWSQLASEWKLDSPTEIAVGPNEKLRVRGRIDLVLGRGEKTNAGLGFPELWIVDYKPVASAGLINARGKQKPTNDSANNWSTAEACSSPYMRWPMRSVRYARSPCSRERKWNRSFT